jgi:hypothetical protein
MLFALLSLAVAGCKEEAKPSACDKTPASEACEREILEGKLKSGR